MTELLNRLSANPADWDLRTSIVRQYYEARDFDMAAKILAQAPKIPSEESSVLFAATVFSHLPTCCAHVYLYLLCNCVSQGG